MQTAFINQGIAALGDIILTNNIKTIFIVTGRNSYTMVEELIQPYLKSVKIILFINSNTGVGTIKEGCIELKKSQADIILAVGGGANIDLAKLINTFSLLDESNYISAIKGITTIDKKYSSLIVMPTTAGTGSEATCFSVVYLGLDKYSVVSQYLLPDYVIVDYILVKGMPKYLQACTAFDAFSQAIESYWSVGATDTSRYYATKSMVLIKDNLLPSIQNKNKQNLVSMAHAAYLSGQAINISKTTAPHALSYYLSSQYNIPHGHAVALMLGVVAKMNIIEGDKKLQNTMQHIGYLLDIDDSTNFSQYWYNLMQQCGLRTQLSEFGIKEADLSLIIDKVNIERLKNHPLMIDKKNFIKELLLEAFV